MVTEQQAHRALEYLAETDEPYAKAKSFKDALEHRRKTLIAVLYSEAKGSNKDREMAALRSQEIAEWNNQMEQAVYDLELISAKRKRAELTIEFWRSLNANRRRGNV